jgi:hypothetical protein
VGRAGEGTWCCACRALCVGAGVRVGPILVTAHVLGARPARRVKEHGRRDYSVPHGARSPAAVLPSEQCVPVVHAHAHACMQAQVLQRNQPVAPPLRPKQSVTATPAEGSERSWARRTRQADLTKGVPILPPHALLAPPSSRSWAGGRRRSRLNRLYRVSAAVHRVTPSPNLKARSASLATRRDVLAMANS